MQYIFSGLNFDKIMASEPLIGAEYFDHGSSAILFQKEGKLYRLTTDCGGQSFLSGMKGDSRFVYLIEEFYLDSLYDTDDMNTYSLAQVEWLTPITENDPDFEALTALLSELSDNDQITEDQCDVFIDRVIRAIPLHPQYAQLLDAAILGAVEVKSHGGVVDCNITNVMRRPTTGELVWSDPIHIG